MAFLTKEEVLFKIRDNAIVAVVRGNTPEKAEEIVNSCIDGGINIIELTFTVPYAHRIIEKISQKYGDKILLGAGTVLDAPTARIAMLSGAQFMVSPHFDPEVTRICNRYRVANMAGILTVKEAIQAMEAGVDILKLFPGDLFGPAFIKDIKGPLPYAQIMPTGGVSIENAGQWIKAGAVAVGVGSNLMKGDVYKNAAALIREINKSKSERG